MDESQSSVIMIICKEVRIIYIVSIGFRRYRSVFTNGLVLNEHYPRYNCDSTCTHSRKLRYSVLDSLQSRPVTQLKHLLRYEMGNMMSCTLLQCCCNAMTKICCCPSNFKYIAVVKFKRATSDFSVLTYSYVFSISI